MTTREQLQRAFRESRSGEVGGIALRLLDAIEAIQEELVRREHYRAYDRVTLILKRALEGSDDAD
jgi:hypothetical protein